MDHRIITLSEDVFLEHRAKQLLKPISTSMAPRCFLCTRHVLPPVRACSSGHAVCANCMRIGNTCPNASCMEMLIHRPALDELARTMPLPCFYRCGRLLHCDALPQHEWRCSQRRPLVRHVSKFQKCRQFCTNMYCVFALFLFIFINYSR
ncbi:E3 ubiquitin-protein ligase Siah2-like isoform X2 [Ctenocephalides felis]|uniref:E3 ubiquitin-protein ligase Siah2-like isoform X2 n=1 Tax=Ctenocephalides felis TaxID=7515 RepID=UPI000E6E313F|nr:E3 ubiquitin-protein ligase Siah2-like isoform X2 [Ctenocephalides felis]